LPSLDAWPAYVCLYASQSCEPKLVKKRTGVISQLRCLLWHEKSHGEGASLDGLGGTMGRGNSGQGGSWPVRLCPRQSSVPSCWHWERVTIWVRTAWAEELKGDKAWQKFHYQILIWPRLLFPSLSLIFCISLSLHVHFFPLPAQNGSNCLSSATHSDTLLTLTPTLSRDSDC
jgi:hypothetical protein